jgi:hypothetical protein
MALPLLSGCSYRGEDIGSPLVRKVRWFSYVGGDDIREACAAGSPDRFRLVYNGIYLDQLRMYEVDALRRLLIVHVTVPGDASRLDPFDLAAPWRAREAREQLDGATYAALVDSFAGSGLFDPPPVGLDLPARSYFWTAAYCRDGAFGFTAWKHPSPAFDRLAFPALLFRLDPTGVPVAEAGPIPFDPI